MLALPRYFITAYGKIAVLVAALCVFVLLIARLTEVTDDFVRYSGPKTDIARYLLNLIPGYLLAQLPVAAFAIAAFHAAHFRLTHELVALWAAGESVRRILRPLFVLVPVLCTLIFFFADLIVVPSNITARHLFENITGQADRSKEELVKTEHLIFADASLFVGAYRPKTQSGSEILLERRLPTGHYESSHCKSIALTANNAELRDCHIITVDKNHGRSRVRESSQVQFDQAGLMRMLGFSFRPINELTISGLIELQKQNSLRGRSSEPALSELYARFALPLIIPIAFALGLMAGIRLVGLGAAGLILAIGIYTLIFHGINHGLRSFASIGLLPPFLGAGIPFVTQLMLAVYFYRRHPV